MRGQWHRTHVLRVALVFTLLLACFCAPSGSAAPPTTRRDSQSKLDGAFVSVRIVGGFTPYRLVIYEVLWRGKVPVAGHYRGLVDYAEALHNMKLVRTADFEKLLRDVERDGAFGLKDAPAPTERAPGALRFEIEVRNGDKHNSVTVTAPSGQPDPRYGRIIDRVRRFVLDRAGELTFRNVFFEPGTYGYVNLTSVPIAKIYIDGRDVQHHTPLYGYELPVGPHEVRLVAEEKGWERTHTLKVEPGMTTIVHFDLR